MNVNGFITIVLLCVLAENNPYKYNYSTGKHKFKLIFYSTVQDGLRYGANGFARYFIVHIAKHCPATGSKSTGILGGAQHRRTLFFYKTDLRLVFFFFFLMISFVRTDRTSDIFEILGCPRKKKKKKKTLKQFSSSFHFAILTVSPGTERVFLFKTLSVNYLFNDTFSVSTVSNTA